MLSLPMLLLGTALPAQGPVSQPAPAFQAGFAAAYAAYRAGDLQQAEAKLVALEREQPRSFDVHELLGLVYAAGHQDSRAAAEMKRAVELQPGSASARNNLATTLVHLHDLPGAEQQWRAALAADPEDYSANRNLARLLLQSGRLAEAVPLLEAAERAEPEAADNRYDLALADMTLGRLSDAHSEAEALLQKNGTAEAHALLGEIEERQGQYLDAVREFSAAAHQDPSEENLFRWGSELLAHRAYEPAITVFRDGTTRFPGSGRLWVGQGMALYSRGDYTPAINALLKATDLDPADARAYLFLSKAYLSSPSQAEEVIARFKRYAELKPDSAQAQFDYAVSLWKGRRVNTPEVDYAAVERLFERSLTLDGSSAETHLQYGVLLNDERKFPEAQAQFERAVALDPALADAHFRLGRAYLKLGEKEKAQVELDRFRSLQAEHQAEVDKERAAVQQFVVASDGGTAHATP